MKDRLKHWLIIAAMVTPPWNVFWWIVGAVYYKVSGASKNDHSGDAGLGLVLAAPVTMPLLPFMLLKERLEKRQMDKTEGLHRQAAEWIAERLAANGVTVESVDASPFSMDIKAAIGPEHADDFRAIMAQAIRTFPKLLPLALFGWRVSGIEYLDRSWAEQNGISEWAEEVVTLPCVDCRIRETRGFVFGRERFGFMRDHMANESHTISLKDGSTRTVDGFICRACLDRIGWTSMSSGRRQARNF